MERVKITQKQFLNKHSRILDELYKITEAKNADYSEDRDALFNFQMVEIFDIVTTEQGILTRICDKFARTCHLIKKAFKAKVKKESIDDTLLDFANYIIILLIYIRSKRKK